MSRYHTPVLLDESLEALRIRPDGTYADLTFGGGGHSRAILQKLGTGGRLFGFDQDADAEANVPQDTRLAFIRNNFRFMRGCLRNEGVEALDGILADLGVSSHHFDTRERGFSFRFEAELDMRMNREAALSAKEVLNDYEEEKLAAMFRLYGEIPQAGKVARSIAAYRSKAPVVTVGQFREAVERCVPKGPEENRFLAKLFQAVRIEVNREMDALQMMLEQALKVLRPGGTLVVITYHSLEDRLVKNFLRSGNFQGEVVRDFFGKSNQPFETPLPKVIVPTEEEIERNGRARSAKLRYAVKR